jgi:RNA polymerase subunit RPABC4/transcription elongation factor Spt4
METRISQVATFDGPVTCPSCGAEVTGHWRADLTDYAGPPVAGQQCPACGHGFAATWPGFTFEPDTVVARRPDLVPGPRDGEPAEEAEQAGP